MNTSTYELIFLKDNREELPIYDSGALLKGD